jgi:septin 7
MTSAANSTVSNFNTTASSSSTLNSSQYTSQFSTSNTEQLKATVKQEEHKNDLLAAKEITMPPTTTPIYENGTLAYKTKQLDGYVGFVNLPNQVYRKAVKKGFEFNFMVVGRQ